MIERSSNNFLKRGLLALTFAAGVNLAGCTPKSADVTPPTKASRALDILTPFQTPPLQAWRDRLGKEVIVLVGRCSPNPCLGRVNPSADGQSEIKELPDAFASSFYLPIKPDSTLEWTIEVLIALDAPLSKVSETWLKDPRIDNELDPKKGFAVINYGKNIKVERLTSRPGPKNYMEFLTTASQLRNPSKFK